MNGENYLSLEEIKGSLNFLEVSEQSVVVERGKVYLIDPQTGQKSEIYVLAFKGENKEKYYDFHHIMSDDDDFGYGVGIGVSLDEMTNLDLEDAASELKNAGAIYIDLEYMY